MSSLTPNRILIIDNDEITLALVSYRLQKEGFLVDTARDGLTAIEMIGEKDYGVILLDVLLPRLDGFGILQHISQNQPHLRERVIIMTVLREDHTLAAEGTFRVIRKPLDYMVLTAVVRECLAQVEFDAAGSWYTPHTDYQKTSAPN